ncbi:MAG: hypothetical protein NZM10_05340 [Fimbriimonadales bacterium]|nr:hypothetical protein [Fimbriimonadales bacterium]
MKTPAEQTTVIETNVLMAASGLAEQAGIECIEQCVQVIEQIQKGTQKLALDSSLLILTEYQENLRTAPNSLGYLFLRKWLDAHWHEVVSVDIQPVNPESGDFGVLQSHSDQLAGFDLSDRKFVATALAAQAQLNTPVPILNATDSDWCEHLNTLRGIGVVVEFLCPELMPNTSECR